MDCRDKFFELVDSNLTITRGQKRILEKLFTIKFAFHHIFFKKNDVPYNAEDVIFVDPNTIYRFTLPSYVTKIMD